MAKMTVQDIDVRGKRVLMRVDFNVPLDKETLEITDDSRITAALPTIQHVLGGGGRLILVSHLGRPKGQVKDEMRLTPVAKRLSELLAKEVKIVDPFADGWDAATAASKALAEGDAMLLENIRFDIGEEKGSEELAQRLAALGDVYVNDAFGTAHRAHASTTLVARILQPAVAGFLMEKELKFLGEALDDPKRPFVAIIGGAKVSTKMGVLEALLAKVDRLIIGGGMAYTFYRAKGWEIGKSLVEEDFIDEARRVMEKAGDKLVLPVDTVVADAFSEEANVKTVPSNAIPEKWEGLDIGPETISIIEDIVMAAGTVVWNGPLGVFEMERFAEGTEQVGRFIAESHAISVIGGGDSAAAIKKFGLTDEVTHVSTGGGASLEFLEGKELPGVAALTDR
ncbi:phosphoglycerate kinase [Candidatus Sumerlaeota bacterium]|nr:phosphoglycerate kinase [Candidatus Sumerlaeota bacterium]